VPGNYLKNPDFNAIARAYGVPARSVKRPEELKEALEWGKGESQRGQPVMVEVMGSSDLKEAIPARYFQIQQSYRPE
jgi:thiamine pyrophosphate-dependent acetolactate synthase large subunit-like protein